MGAHPVPTGSLLHWVLCNQDLLQKNLLHEGHLSNLSNFSDLGNLGDIRDSSILRNLSVEDGL